MKTKAAVSLPFVLFFPFAFLFFLLATDFPSSDSSVRGEEPPVLSFANWSETRGPLTVRWEPVAAVTGYKPVEAFFVFENKGNESASASLEFSATDTVRILDDAEKPSNKTTRSLEIPAGGVSRGSVRFVLLPGTYSAHYPLHLRASVTLGGQETLLHAVRVVEARLAAAPVEGKTFAPTDVKLGGVSLLGKNYHAFYNIDGGNSVTLGDNYIGNDAASRTSVFDYPIERGEKRRAFSVHPPYVPKGGSLYLDFPVKLPNFPIVSLDFGVALRTPSANEPASDGVTFRVWAEENGDRELLDEIHTDSKTWVDRTANLSKYAGKEVSLLIEFNPGPKNDTTCDGAFISGLLLSGFENDAQRQAAIEPPAVKSSGPFIFPLADGFTATVTPGAKGLLDADYAFKSEKTGKELLYHGMNLSVGNIALRSPGVFFRQYPVLEWDDAAKKLTCRMIILQEDQLRPVTFSVAAVKGLFVVEIPEMADEKTPNPTEIGRLSFGPTDDSADRVYAGHGVVIDHPHSRLEVAGEGHRLASSHVGFDFPSGISILMGSSLQPNFVVADPHSRLYSLDCSGVVRMAVVPSDHGAFAAAVRYRKNSPWRPEASEGTIRKAGRLVFDVWGGKYVNNQNNLERAFQYGVTDSLFVKHVWQRWGYDVRLPDIWGASESDAVLQSLGNLDELRALADSCRSRDVPFALHDNYIDFYPDADGFSYDNINFQADGTPRKAWINYGMGVQSYQWRPDLFKPFLERNMKLANRYLPQMDAYFVDVFTSIGLFPYYDRAGNFHPKSETKRCWQDAFRTIGSALTTTGPDGKKRPGITMSEAGSDSLIGGIDGADAQWLGIAKEPRAWSMGVSCDDWARTPWLAAVHHTNFSRHGAGYEDRYRANRSRGLHGIMSDDYLTTEVLGGVDLMVDEGTVFPGSIRKHYLAQHVVRARANQEIESVEFAKDDAKGGQPNVCRQTVTWSDGTRVFANRGPGDWTAKEGVTLPYFGYYAESADGRLLSAILKNPANPAETVEISDRGDSFYLGGRGAASTSIFAITPTLASSEVLNENQFKIAIDWRCDEGTGGDLSTFIHVYEAYRGYGHVQKGWVAGGERPQIPTSSWGKKTGNGDSTVVRTDGGAVLTVPDEIPSGVYQIMVGLYDSANGGRIPLMGEDAGQTRYSIAEVAINRGAKHPIRIRPLPMTEDRDLFFRLKANKTPVSWRGVTTNGYVSVTPGEKVWKFLPIPVMENFTIALDETALGGEATSVTCAGNKVPFKRDGNRIFFDVTAKDAAVYEVTRGAEN